uniref:Acyl-CoA delta-9 desaturase n=1 Tax=Thitarodes pui TaxID=507567 RepID=D1MAD7_THIPU|nr:acyl-CoA delta-9 desaturase [Thitarodes pui]
MAPNNTVASGVLFENDAKTEDFGLDTTPVKTASDRKMQIVWGSVLQFGLFHVAALYGAKLFFTSAKWQTDAFAFLLYIMSTLGITAGVHRLWTHRAYKAKWPLRLILIAFNTLAFQDPVMKWVRDHRLHHKYSDTDADPHNATRGFFFSHMGWLMVRKHPEVLRKGKDIDLSDLYADPIVTFQKKYYMILMPLTCFVMPTLIPAYYWNESYSTAFFVAGFFRYITLINTTFLVNSAAHMWGNKPYDKYINPVQNISVSLLTLGEGYHNYHHAFPWDYRAAEFGFDYLNLSTHFINFFSKIGWAYDLKTIQDDIMRKRIIRTGDGSHELWGLNDKGQPKEGIENVLQ